MAETKKPSTLLGEGGIARIRRLFPGDGGATVERRLWDSVAQEPAKLSGMRFRLYSIRRAKNRHPLYGEPSVGGDWEFSGPWEMACTLDYAQGDAIQPEASTEGLRKTSNAVLWVARKEFEDASAPEPKIGDVVDFWEMPPFAGAAEIRFWDVTQANPDGNMFTIETFVMWRIELKVKTTFDPERKVTGTRI